MTLSAVQGGQKSENLNLLQFVINPQNKKIIEAVKTFKNHNDGSDRFCHNEFSFDPKSGAELLLTHCLDLTKTNFEKCGGTITDSLECTRGSHRMKVWLTLTVSPDEFVVNLIRYLVCKSIKVPPDIMELVLMGNEFPLKIS